MDFSSFPHKNKFSTHFGILDENGIKKQAIDYASANGHVGQLNESPEIHRDDLKRSKSAWTLQTANHFSGTTGPHQVGHPNHSNQADKWPDWQNPSAPNMQPHHSGQDAVDELVAKLSMQQATAGRKKDQRTDDGTSSPSTDPFENATPTSSKGDELSRLKRELADANARMAQMNHELTQSRITQHTVEEALGSPYPAAAQRLAFQNDMGGKTAPVTAMPSPLSAPLSQGPWRMDSANQSFGDMFHAHHMADPVGTRPNSAFGSRKGQQHMGAPPLLTSMSFPSPFVLPNGIAHVQQPPIGTKLSPTAPEFAANGAFNHNGHNMMSTNGRMTTGDRFSVAADPVNYRQLLEHTSNCNWKFIVDKIVGSNDQQASIFLQQKLKIGDADQKFSIVQAIIEQAYPLMINRFGNFLVQRCFEHGLPDQVIAIAQAIRGNVLNLSMDAFGCHVIQKAFDCVPEEYKALMVHELLRRIPETVIHRYACHVWQKLFELRWSGCPPQIMRHVNEALRGMWHEVALGETGSLVVQNIFENCLEDDKRPCVNEVLSAIDTVAHGQFGNWCIQHICEHGNLTDRTRAVDHIVRYAFEYSTDQFASKVVEKCLKIGGNEFLDRFLNQVCEPRVDCPRMALIDIAGDQFGNYLVQFILTHADPQRREIVAAHIRKHMVSLRGSKYGSRVAMLCSNPAMTIRPGPPPGMAPLRNVNSHDRFAGEPGRNFSGGFGRGFPPTFR